MHYISVLVKRTYSTWRRTDT